MPYTLNGKWFKGEDEMTNLDEYDFMQFKFCINYMK